jgi:hypothetical protein
MSQAEINPGGTQQDQGSLAEINFKPEGASGATASAKQMTAPPERKPSVTSSYQPQHPALRWLEKRLPIGRLIHAEFVAYPTPRNLNYWWTFGAILSLLLGVQIVTGIVLAMHYTPHADLAFESIEEDHAGRQLRLAAAIPSLQRRINVLCCCLRPHVS